MYHYYPHLQQGQQQERRELLLLPSLEGDNRTAFLAGFAAAADAAEAAAGAAVAAGSAAMASAAQETERTAAATTATSTLPPEIIRSLQRQDTAIAAAARAVPAVRAAAAAAHAATAQAASATLPRTWSSNSSSSSSSSGVVDTATSEPAAANASSRRGGNSRNGSISNRQSSSETSSSGSKTPARQEGSKRGDSVPAAAAAGARTRDAASAVKGGGGETRGAAAAASAADPRLYGASALGAAARLSPLRLQSAARAVSARGRDNAASAGAAALEGRVAAAAAAEDDDGKGDSAADGAAEDNRERRTAAAIRAVPLQEVLPTAELRCTYATHMARVYAQQLDLWQRFAAQLSLQLQISRLFASSASPSSINAPAAPRAGVCRHMMPPTAAACAPVGSAAADAFAAYSLGDRGVHAGRRAAADSTSSDAAAGDSRLEQQPEAETPDVCRSSRGRETQEDVFLLDGSPRSIASSRSVPQQQRRVQASAAADRETSAEKELTRSREEASQRDTSGDAEDTSSSGQVAGAAAALEEAAGAAREAGEAGEAGAAEAAGAAGENAGRRMPAWQQYNIGLIVRLLLLLFLFDAGKEVYVAAMLLMLLYIGGLFDPIISWFQRSSHHQPLDVTLARLRRRRERRPLRELQRQQQLLRISTDLNSGRRTAHAGTPTAAEAAAADVSASATAGEQQQQHQREQLQVEAVIRETNAATEYVEDIAPGTEGTPAAPATAPTADRTAAAGAWRVPATAVAAFPEISTSPGGGGRDASYDTEGTEERKALRVMIRSLGGDLSNIDTPVAAHGRTHQGAQDIQQQEGQTDMDRYECYKDPKKTEGQTGDCGEANERETGELKASQTRSKTIQETARENRHDKTMSSQSEEEENSLLHHRRINTRRRCIRSSEEEKEEAPCQIFGQADATGDVEVGERGGNYPVRSTTPEEQQLQDDVRASSYRPELSARLRIALQADNCLRATAAGHAGRGENTSSRNASKSGTAAGNNNAFAAGDVLSDRAPASSDDNMPALEASSARRSDVTGGRPAAATAGDQQQEQQQQPSTSSGHAGRIRERRLRTVGGWRSYCERAFYEGVVMFFLTFIPSWNPNPRYLRDFEDDGDDEEEEQEEPAEFFMAADGNDGGFVVGEQEVFEF